jgi:hypothetical protein
MPNTSTESSSSGDRFEGQRDTVHAVAKTGRLGAIVEDVPQMAAALAAMYGRPDHAERCVSGGADRAVKRRPKTRPAGSTLELGCRGERLKVATDAGKIAAPLFVQQFAGEGALGRALPQHCVLIGGQEFAPLGIGVGNLEVLGCRRRAADPPSRASRRRDSYRTTRQKKSSRHHVQISQFSLQDTL